MAVSSSRVIFPAFCLLLSVFCVLAGTDAGSLPEHWSIRKLYTRPWVWGTLPLEVTWSEDSRKLVFAWNDHGMPFRDLWAFDAASRKLARLTNMEGVKDEMGESEAERDERQRRYLPPEEGISAFDVSHDGREVVFVHRGDLYVVSTEGGGPRRLTRTKPLEGNPRFSPDGKSISFTRDNDLWLLGSDGELRQLTTSGGPDQLNATSLPPASAARFHRWSPDGRKIAYQATNIKNVRSLLIPNYAGRFVTARPQRRGVAGDENPQVSLLVLALDGNGKPVTLGEADDRHTVLDWEWSPDSTRIAINRVTNDRKHREVLVADAATGKTVTVYQESDERWISPLTATLVWSPDSRQLLLSTERDYNHLMIVPAGYEPGVRPVEITRGPFEVTGSSSLFYRVGRGPQWIKGANRILFTSTEQSPAERHLYSVSPAGAERTRITSREGLNEALVSPDGRFAAILYSNPKQPPDLYLMENRTGAPLERISASPLKEFSHYAWPEPRFVEFKSRADGKTIHAKLLLPPDVKWPPSSAVPGKKYPAVVFVHGAGYAQSVLKQWGSYNPLSFVFDNHLAQRGYVVLDLDYRGSSGYGRDWRSEVYLHLGGLDLEDEISGVEYLRTLGFVDTARVGIWGISYGGFMTDMAMFKAPQVFKAGAAWAAVTDWENYNPGYTRERLTTPKENPEAYRRSSPIHFSSGLEGPLLIIHGMVDDNVHFQDDVQLAEKLIHEGKKFEEMFYPEEKHAFVRDETLIDAYTRTAEFFDRYLK